jgi:hypothetical protein
MMRLICSSRRMQSIDWTLRARCSDGHVPAENGQSPRPTSGRLSRPSDPSVLHSIIASFSEGLLLIEPLRDCLIDATAERAELALGLSLYALVVCRVETESDLRS